MRARRILQFIGLLGTALFAAIVKQAYDEQQIIKNQHAQLKALIAVHNEVCELADANAPIASAAIERTTKALKEAVEIYNTLPPTPSVKKVAYEDAQAANAYLKHIGNKISKGVAEINEALSRPSWQPVIEDRPAQTQTTQTHTAPQETHEHKHAETHGQTQQARAPEQPSAPVGRFGRPGGFRG